MADADVTDSGVSGGKDTNEEEIEENGNNDGNKENGCESGVKKQKNNPKHKLQPCGRWFNVLNNVRLNKKKTVIFSWPSSSSQRGKGTSYSLIPTRAGRSKPKA